MERNGDARDAGLGDRDGLERQSARPADAAFGRVTPSLQARYTVRAFERVRAQWPWLQVAVRLVLEARRRDESRPGLVLVPPGRSRLHACSRLLRAARRRPDRLAVTRRGAASLTPCVCAAAATARCWCWSRCAGAAGAAATSGDGERLLAPTGVPAVHDGHQLRGPGRPGLADVGQRQVRRRRRSTPISAAPRRPGSTPCGSSSRRRWPSTSPPASGTSSTRSSALAEKHGLQLIVSLHDYGERDLARVAATAGQIAQRYRGRPGILAFDLKNEPRFGDLALAKYAAPPPLQQRGLIDAFGERLARAELADYRASDDGTKTIPAYLSDDEAWIYVNNLRLYREMLAEAAAWVAEHDFQTTTLDYLDDRGRPEVGAARRGVLDGTLQAWLAPQVEAIRAADPTRPITVDHVDAVLAKLPANDALDFQSLHRYPATSAASIRANLELRRSLRAAHPGKPYLLSEFGYATDTVDPERAALHETAIMLGLLAQHAARRREVDAQRHARKASTCASGRWARSASTAAQSRSSARWPPCARISDAPAARRATSARGRSRIGLRYVYRASDALLLGGKQRRRAAARACDADGPAQLFVTWSEPGVVRLWASAALQATLDLGQILGGNVRRLSLVALDGDQEQPSRSTPQRRTR